MEPRLTDLQVASRTTSLVSVRALLHGGNETGLCPMLPEIIEHLIDSYLPDRYTEFTPEDQADVEQSYGFKRLTMTMIVEMIDEMVARHNSAEVSDTGVARSNTASEVEYQF
ncbi:unnamed protein product [Phytophthora fragariaefolia]|uniref:Unnamed protein product n=1 Tax=Phytophthora fragariaefolia TaxID=1490495 RepID=A0A9W6Y0E7_9STRA|nr:unnamed protein product [Phytophthora fragariaefolia]